MTDSSQLNAEQLHSLHDILSHHEVYQEIADFKHPGALATYGPPFAKHEGQGHAPTFPSHSPALQALLSRFALTVPGVRDFPKNFWQDQIVNIIENLQKAELSESYDKGIIGVRRTLSTAVASLLEYPARGIITGLDVPDTDKKPDEPFDTANAKELQRGFREFMQQAVYANALDDAFAKAAQTDKLNEHSALMQALHEYLIVNVASFMHYALILSPKGQSLLVLIDQAHRMIPYIIVKQTLKIGNVATMVQGMIRVVLAKVSVGTVTNWIGLSQGADEGMNLMQQIISGVLGWENRDLKSRAAKIERSKSAPSKEQLAAIKAYLQKSPEEHDAIRSYSQQSEVSIVHAILSSANTSTSLGQEQHERALEYLALLLSVRDRDELVKVLCRSNPDDLTQAVRDGVSAYDPVIRQLHNAVNLSDTVNDFERFVNDTLKLAKLPPDVKDRKQPLPTVGDFVQLIRKHVTSTHKFLHQCAKNGPELTKWFFDWSKHAAEQFKRQSSDDGDGPSGAGDISKPLHDLYSSLSAEDQEKIVPILDTHAKHLSTLHASSTARLTAVLESPATSHPVLASKPSSRSASGTTTPARSSSADATDPGPGAYLARWQDLLDHSAITPAQAEGGKVRSGGSGSVLAESKRLDVDPHRADAAAADPGSAESDATTPSKADVEQDQQRFEAAQDKLESFGVPRSATGEADVTLVIALLGAKYRRLLGDKFRATESRRAEHEE